MSPLDAAIHKALTWAAEAVRTESREYVAVVIECMVDGAR